MNPWCKVDHVLERRAKPWNKNISFISEYLSICQHLLLNYEKVETISTSYTDLVIFMNSYRLEIP